MAVVNLRTLFAWPDDPTPVPMPDDMFAQRALNVRRADLSVSDWRMLPDSPGDKSAWTSYRAALRDGPAILATRNGDEVTMPDPPE